MNRAFNASWKCLDKIFSDKAFSGIELNNTLSSVMPQDKALITKIVYGVLDTNIELEYIIDAYAQKVKPTIYTLLKIGVYCLKYLSIPKYAVLNDIVELSKQTEKIQYVSFVNATLRKIEQALESNEVQYPANNKKYLSVKYSFPLWAVNKMVKQYGIEQTEQFLSCEQSHLTHIRINTQAISKPNFIKMLKKSDLAYEEGMLEDDLSVKGSLSVIPSNLYTIMSLGSMLVARAVGVKDNDKVLDLCSAPGGKAVYLAQLAKNVSVTACDVHEHRVELIKNYAKRMNASSVKAMQNDATAFIGEFENNFDVVLVDAPCSGFGVYASKPDIKLNTDEKMLDRLAKTQLSILNNAGKYVKVGGSLVYSTCTIFHDENQGVIYHFVQENPNFEREILAIPDRYGKESQKQFLPHIDGVEGFFVAKLKRVK